MTMCVCADPAMCGGCDPTPDWEHICALHLCRIARWAAPWTGVHTVRIRPNFARRRRKEADRVARTFEGKLFA